MLYEVILHVNYLFVSVFRKNMYFESAYFVESAENSMSQTLISIFNLPFHLHLYSFLNKFLMDFVGISLLVT